MIILPKHKLIIVTPPKCGTITIHNAVEKINELGEQFNYHITIRELVERKKINSANFFSLCVVRNPWTRMVSCYEFIKHNEMHHWHKEISQLTFESYLKKFAGGINPCFNWAKDCDQIIMFEKLKRSLEQVFMMFGVKHEKIGHYNRSLRKQQKYYNTQRSIDIVEERYKSDIEIGGYYFPEGL